MSTHHSHHAFNATGVVRGVALTAVAALLAACGGGGGSGASSVPAPATTPGPVVGTGPGAATVTITIPSDAPTQSTVRRESYVSPATSSLSVSVGSAAPTVIGLATYPGCTATSAGRACTISLALPTGQVALDVRTFASNDATGTPLSIGTTSATVMPNTSNPINLTMRAVIKSLQVAVVPTTFVQGVAATAAVTVTGYDAASKPIALNGATVVDSGNSTVTISLTDSDTSGATAVSPAILGATAESAQYTGGAVPANAVVTAIATSGNKQIASASAALAFASASPTPTPAPTSAPTAAPTKAPTPAPTAAPTSTPTPGPVTASTNGLTFTAAGDVQTFAVSQSGYSGPFTASVSGGDPAAASASISGSTVSVTAVHAGTTNVVVSGGNGSTVTIPIGVTTTSITVQ